MQLANAQVALGGNRGNTVRKYRITPAEVVVLQYLHGLDAVFDIEPLDETVDRSKREERLRLAQTYGWQEGERFVSPVLKDVYPSANNIEDDFDELELPSNAYMAVSRMVAPKPEPKKGETSQRKSNRARPPERETDDGDGDMPSTGNAALFS